MSQGTKLVYVDIEGLEVIEVSEDVNPPRGLTLSLETSDAVQSSGFYIVEKHSRGGNYDSRDKFTKVDITALVQVPKLLQETNKFLRELQGREIIPAQLQKNCDDLELRISQITEKIIGGN